MQSYFYEIADALTALLRGNEVYTASFGGEDSDFVRFNHGKVRQAGVVRQRSVTVDLMDGRCHAAGTATLCGDLSVDRARLSALVASLREQRGFVPEDPHLAYATEIRSSERLGVDELPERSLPLAAVAERAGDLDLVGIYAAGGIFAGFANSLGQRNWFATYNFNLDWSAYLHGDKAVKASYAGVSWRDDEFAERIERGREQLAVLERPAKTIAPGGYRVYLAPAALDELVGILGWGGFGFRAHRTKTTPLVRMIEEGARLHPGISFTEDTGAGRAPDFQEAGFARPSQVPLIVDGGFAECLVSPRSAAEFGVETNGASGGESPQSLVMAAGDLAPGDVLRRLGTGLYVSNLHYMNFSDRTACRTTGMTRFATFWVEGGVIQASVNVMRFDETLYRMLGERLVGLTAERELTMDPLTYGRRSTHSTLLPGALVEDFTFTL